mgnify:CR=1 FL=1
MNDNLEKKFENQYWGYLIKGLTTEPKQVDTRVMMKFSEWDSDN